jgi:hypothetical protein
VNTVLLGQFTWEHANAIAGKLEQAGITWWHKQSGAIAQVLFRGDWGVRLFVDAERLEEARAIAAEVASPPEQE